MPVGSPRLVTVLRAGWDGGSVLGEPMAVVTLAGSRRRTWLRGAVRRLLVGLLVVAAFLLSSVVVQAATAPGRAGFDTRLAEAARDDGFGFVVDAVRAVGLG